jgi:hypothetical protein
MTTARGMVQGRALALVGSAPATGGVVTASAADRGPVAATLDEVTAGRVSLGMLGALVVVVVLFYLWTREVQGGG